VRIIGPAGLEIKSLKSEIQKGLYYFYKQLISINGFIIIKGGFKKSAFYAFISGLSRKVGKFNSIIIYLRSKGINKISTKAIIILSLFKININLGYNDIN
jgi:hypothetical protein